MHKHGLERLELLPGVGFCLIRSLPGKTTASLKRKVLLRVKPNKKSLMKRK